MDAAASVFFILSSNALISNSRALRKALKVDLTILENRVGALSGNASGIEYLGALGRVGESKRPFLEVLPLAAAIEGLFRFFVGPAFTPVFPARIHGSIDAGVKAEATAALGKNLCDSSSGMR